MAHIIFLCVFVLFLGSMIIPNHNETRCLQPKALQVALDHAMNSVKGRCFVRPSGTENVVRVYAEAATRQDADWLAAESAKLVAAHQPSQHHVNGHDEQQPVLHASKL
jgi:hypothetical protein